MLIMIHYTRYVLPAFDEKTRTDTVSPGRLKDDNDTGPSATVSGLAGHLRQSIWK